MDPEWKEKIWDYKLNIVLISEIEKDEELNLLFLRLQIASILNAGEKLHAMTGDMRDTVFLDIGRHSYFATYSEGTFNGVTPIRDLWVYITESFTGEGCKSIYDNGDTDENLDIVFVGHGYTISDFPRYASSVE